MNSDSSRFSPQKNPTRRFQFPITVAIVLAAFLLRFAVEEFSGAPFQFVTFFFAVVFSTWYGGMRCGIFALALSVILVNYVFQGPRMKLVIPDIQYSLELFVYIILGLAGVWMMDSQKRIRREAEIAADVAREEAEFRKAAEQNVIQAQTELKEYVSQLEDRVRERTAELEKSLRFLERFLYSMAHEIRAPVRAMEGFADVLREDYAPQLDETAQDYCARLAAAAQRLDVLIADLLSYGRMAHLRLPVGVLDLNQIVADVIADLHFAEFVLVQRGLPSVLGHPAPARIAVSNILTNAMKFVAPGVTPQILISTEERGDEICLVVSDNGIGIEPEYMEKIFEPFQRLHTQDAYAGSGIGLALVKLCMERMGGNVNVISDTGKGSQFRLCFKRIESPHPEKPRPKEMHEAVHFNIGARQPFLFLI